jgi:hypothetical protein
MFKREPTAKLRTGIVLVALSPCPVVLRTLRCGRFQVDPPSLLLPP